MAAAEVAFDGSPTTVKFQISQDKKFVAGAIVPIMGLKINVCAPVIIHLFRDYQANPK